MHWFIRVSIVLLAMTQVVLAQDISNSYDHPAISRYPGQTIRRFSVKDFDQYNLVLGVDRTGAPSQIKKLEGKVTRIYYANPKGRSTTEIFRNFADAVHTGGGEILFACEGRECGTPIRWTEVNGISATGGIVDNRYLAVRLTREGKEVFLSIFIGGQSTQLHAVEVQPMDTGLVTLNADQLSAGLIADGHVAVYGILFDSGKSTLRAESKLAIAEIAKLLRAQEGLKLFIVGHTDSVGSFESNLRLSRDRAAAVVSVLSNDHGIAVTRLAAHGVGPLVPVASNSNEAGRARNRRVDLVVQ